jgi:hypothetical protein
MADEKELLIKLELQSDQLQKSVTQVDKKMGELNKQQTATKKGLAGLKAGYLAIAGVLTGVVAKAMGIALKAASDFEEANSKFGVVFRGVSKEANAMRQELVNSYGVSTLAATEMLSGIQDFLVPMGLARDEAAQLSGNFAKLAVDIGSFNNAPTAEVLQAIKSGLAGQSEPMRRFGVDISETTLKQMALSQGIELTNGKLDRQSRAQLLYQKIIQDSTDALGDFERTQNSTANVMKRAAAIGEDIKLVFGQELAREIQPVVDGFREFIGLEGGLEKIRKVFRGLFILIRFIGKGIEVSIIKPLVLSIKIAINTVKGLASLAKAVAKRDFGSIKDIIKKSFKETTKPIVDTAKELKDFYVNIFKDTVDLFKNTQEKAIEGTDLIVEDTKKKNQELVESNKLTKEQIAETNMLFRDSEKMAEDITLQEKIDRVNALLAVVKKGTEEEKKLQKAKTNFNIQLRKSELEATKATLDSLSTLTQSNIKEVFKVGKAASLAQAIINTVQAVTRTMATTPFPFNIPLAAAQAAAGAVQVNKISNTKFQGKAQGGVVDEVMGSPMNGEDGFIGIQRGESVLTREATSNMGRGVIDAINKTGGRASLARPVFNITVMNPNPQEVVNVINDYGRQFGFSDNGVSL